MKKNFARFSTTLLTNLILTTQTFGTTDMATKKLVRYIDEKEPYTQTCEHYEYFPLTQRHKLLKNKDFMFGDILSDTVVIEPINPEFLPDRNMTSCDDLGMDTNIFETREELEHENGNFATIKRTTYTYGAGAAHGNSSIVRFVYDREYGNSQSWNSLFGDSEPLNSHILRRVNKELADKAFVSHFGAQKNIDNYRKKGYFGLTEKGLVIQYRKYEIASGAAGLPHFEVSKETLKMYISKEKFDKCFPKKETKDSRKEFISEF